MFRKLVKAVIPGPIFDRIEPLGHWGEAVLANLVYGFPARKLKVIGVTGTDGKTTTSSLIQAMLQQSGYQVALMTTISIDDGNGPQPNPTRLTTIGAMAMFRQLREIARAKPDFLVLETTSHALAQRRVWGIPYHLVVMTNVTHEHLDYHRTFEKYRDAKVRLFKLANANKRGLRTGIINGDDASADLFRAEIAKSITYGLKKGDLLASNVKSAPYGSLFRATYLDRTLNISVNLAGSFNVANALAAAGAGIALGLTNQQIEEGIAALKYVEGRMNTIDEGQNFSVYVDYAHTPESFEKIFNEIRPLTSGRMIVVFGSAGRRDAAKRGLQGQVAGRLADLVVATEEDDRDEDGQAILKQIAEGAVMKGKTLEKDLFLIHDRTKAIQFAITQAQPGDSVLLLGKGHEKSILSNDGKHAWDEAAVARQILKGVK